MSAPPAAVSATPTAVTELSAAGRTLAFKIGGMLPGVAEGQSVAVMDIGAAQWRFGALGRLQRIDLKLAEGADAARLRGAIAAMLPNITLSATGGSAATAIGQLFGAGTGFWSIGANVAQTVFDGGALRARSEAARSADRGICFSQEKAM